MGFNILCLLLRLNRKKFLLQKFSISIRYPMRRNEFKNVSGRLCGGEFCFFFFCILLLLLLLYTISLYSIWVKWRGRQVKQNTHLIEFHNSKNSRYNVNEIIYIICLVLCHRLVSLQIIFIRRMVSLLFSFFLISFWNVYFILFNTHNNDKMSRIVVPGYVYGETLAV